MGRTMPPFDAGVLTLHEYASSALGRALEMQARIQRSENDGRVAKGSNWYKFRTGELRSYIELFRDAVGLGESRRAVARMEYDERGSI